MEYRYDEDLEFLRDVPSEELNDLVECLVRDRDGDARFTEELTAAERYRRHYPDHHQYWDLIAGEIQCFGANTFMTLIRGGKGVPYREVLADVCDRLKVNYNSNSSTARIEDCLLMKVCEDALDRMTPEEIEDLCLECGMKTVNYTPEVALGVFQAVFKMGGIRSYQLTLAIANAVMKLLFGRGLTIAGNITLTRAMSVLAGPVGWVVTGVWTALDIAGAAYRVTVPAVFMIAMLRKKQLCRAGGDGALPDRDSGKPCEDGNG
jgi:uncharacterized protein YaaW (UPF0174 family)